MQHIYGLSGQEEALAIKSIEAELDDAECVEDDDTSFKDWQDEQEYLDDARQGAGYESEWAF